MIYDQKQRHKSSISYSSCLLFSLIAYRGVVIQSFGIGAQDRVQR